MSIMILHFWLGSGSATTTITTKYGKAEPDLLFWRLRNYLVEFYKGTFRTCKNPQPQVATCSPKQVDGIFKTRKTGMLDK